MGVAFSGSGNPFKKQHTEETLRIILQKIHAKPNASERRLAQIILDLGLPMEYVGDGRTIIGGLNPDFISTDNRKLIVELFGRGFHLPGKLKKVIPIRQTEAGRRAHYRRSGFELLVVWHNELRAGRPVGTVEKKLLQFFGKAAHNVEIATS